MTRFPFISLVITKDFLAYLKALSVKLQGRYIDVVSAYNHINFVLSTLKKAREDVEAVHRRMYDRAVHLASLVNVVESLPRTTNWQQHRSNTPATTTSEYFKRTITIPALDHLIAKIDTRFSRDSSSVVCQAALLLPSAIARSQDVITTIDIADLVTMYSGDLPAPESLDTELHCWNSMWQQNSGEAATLNAPVKVVKSIDPDFFPNLNIPLGVTSAECKHSISRLRCLKTYLQSTMTESRLNGLALLYTHRDIVCSHDVVVENFAKGHPRRMHL